MKNSIIMRLATDELLSVVNQISNKYRIEPTAMSFIIDSVANKVNALAISECASEVNELEIKILKAQNDEHTEDFGKPKEETTVHELVPKVTAERKSGSIDDLVTALRKNGVKVTETRKSTDDQEELSASDSDNNTDTVTN